MKAKFFTLFMLISFLSLDAFSNFSKLSLRMFDNSNIYVVFDGTIYNTQSNIINIANLTPGNHYLEVYKHRPLLPNRPPLPAVLVYSDYVHIPAKCHISAMIDRFKRFVIINKKPLRPYTGYYGQNNYSGYYGYGSNGYYTINTYGNNSHYHFTPIYMSQVDFVALKRSMRYASFDDSKLRIARSAISTNKVTTAQVKGLIRLLTFESSKVKLAKFAYAQTVDKNRYFTVMDEFTFESSKRELVRFIGH